MSKELTIKQHWLQCATKIASPNFDHRPDEQDISLIVIHCISLPPAQFGGTFIDDLFLNRLQAKQHPYFQTISQLKVSSHLLIDRQGAIKQFVPFNKRAWHAGASEYQGKKACNDYSIGIELEGTDNTPFEPIQYQKLQQIINALITSYPLLSKSTITGHSDIAPGRKTDPGEFFDWSKLYRLMS